MTHEIALSPDQLKRVQGGIVEAQKQIDREMGYSKELRNTKLIEESIAHIRRMEGLLITKKLITTY